MIVYIDSRHACELFVFISLPLLIYSMRSRFSMCLCILIHFMHSRRLFKSTLYHVLMQFGRIRLPIDRHTHRQCIVYVLVFRARVLSISSSSSMYSLSTLFAFKNWFHAYLAFFEFFAATRFIRVSPIAQGCRSTDRCEHICKHFASFHRCASRTWQCNIRLI